MPEPMQALPPIPMVGRANELRTLTTALDAASRGRGGVHFVVGEGGVGKTRLVLQLADVARAKGFGVVVGRAFPVETGIPYALFADAFLPTIRAMPAAMLQVLTRGSVTELGMLFPVLRADHPSRPVGDDAEVKPRLFDALGGFIQRKAAREPLLVVLENLHWADPSSLELFHFLARAGASHPVVLLCTYDDTRRDAHPTLRSVEQSLRSLDVLQVHRLQPLTKAETLELIQAQFGAAPDVIGAFVSRIYARTLGNPFFIEESIKSLVSSGRLVKHDTQWTGWDAEDLELPVTIRDAIGAQLARLTTDARRVATLAAVVGVQVPFALLEMISGLAGDALLHAVDELRAQRLMTESEANGQLAYDFTHPLLREVLYSELSRARARTMHAEIADALERLHGDRALSHADTLAVHFLNAAAPAQAARASRYLVIAGRSALARGANREAAESLEAALSIIEQAPADSAEHGTVLDLVARARQRLGDYATATKLWTRAVALATTRNDMRRVASLERRLGLAAFWTGDVDGAIAHYGRGLEAATHVEAEAAALLLARSAVLLEGGRAEEGLADIQAALAIAERSGDASMLSRVQHALQLHAMWRGPADSARAHGARALEYAHAADDRAAAWNVEWASAVHAGLTGDRPAVARHVEAATALAEELRSPVLRLRISEVAIEYRTGTGDWEEALTLADQSIADARAFSQKTLLARLLAWSSLLRFGRGDLEIGTAQMEEAWTLSRADHVANGTQINVHGAVPAHVSRTTWHMARQEHAAALAVAEAGIALVDRTGYISWSVHRLVPLAAEAALFLRDYDRAVLYGNRLRRDAEQLGHPIGRAWADATFALIPFLKGDAHGSIKPIEAAVLALEAIPFVDYAARLRRVLADAYFEAGDIDGCVRELRRVHETFARLGAIPALDHVREKFRQLGVRPPSRSVEEGIGALTGREVEIARLVAARKSNKEIGTTLKISSRTVGTHLSNIFGKLGVDSRGALTDLVRDGALERSVERTL